jgi:hypothetical protein
VDFGSTFSEKILFEVLKKEQRKKKKEKRKSEPLDLMQGYISTWCWKTLCLSEDMS